MIKVCQDEEVRKFSSHWLSTSFDLNSPDFYSYYLMSFSVMKIFKTRLRNKMEDEFLWNYLIVHIDKGIAQRFSMDSIIDEFDSLIESKVALK